MRTLLTLLGTVVTGGLLWAQSALEIPDEPLARIQVLDEQGQPIRTAKVHVSATVNRRRHMATMPAWQAVNARGVCVVEGEMSHRFQMREILAGTLPVELQVMVAAPGYVPLYFGRAANPRETINATLKPARSFELRLLTAAGEPVNLRMPEDLYQEHRNSPLLIGSVDGAPVCALGEQQSERFRASGAPPLCLNFGIYPLGDGRYRVDVPQEFEGALVLMVHSPEVIRYYLRTLEPNEWQSGTVEVRLPKPGMMVLEIDLEAWRTAYKDLSQLSLRVAPQAEAPSTLLFYSNAFVGRRFSGGLVAERNVAPGAYQASLYLWGKDTHQTTLQVPEGGVVRQKIAPKPFDVADYRGAAAGARADSTPRRQVAGGRVLPRGTHARLRTSAHPAGRQTGQKRRVRAKQPVRESSGHRRLQRHRLPNLCE
jgi:hypothetical protein